MVFLLIFCLCFGLQSLRVALLTSKLASLMLENDPPAVWPPVCRCSEPSMASEAFSLSSSTTPARLLQSLQSHPLFSQLLLPFIVYHSPAQSITQRSIFVKVLKQNCRHHLINPMHLTAVVENNNACMCLMMRRHASNLFNQTVADFSTTYLYIA